MVARRRSREQTIFFPWERRGGLLRFGWVRARPLLAAAAMIGLLLLLGARERTRTGVRTTRAALVVVREALDAYRADHEYKCPPSLETLRQEGYLHIEPVDAWGRHLQLTCPGRRNPDSYDLVSFGPSGDLQGLDRVE
jgi:general secretion pathway protein G